MSNNKPLCIDGVQTRFEGGRGIVELPCCLCRPEDFEAWAREWHAAPKPEAPKVQQPLFESPNQEAFG